MSTDDKTILKIKEIAKSAIPSGSKAILYGSRARGDARNDSDWDILILLDKDKLEQTDYDRVSYPFVLLGCDLGTEINPILYTKKEWESYNFTPFYENVNRDGISLTSNPQPIGFRGNLLVKRPKFFYCTYSLGITETS